MGWFPTSGVVMVGWLVVDEVVGAVTVGLWLIFRLVTGLLVLELVNGDEILLAMRVIISATFEDEGVRFRIEVEVDGVFIGGLW